MITTVVTPLQLAMRPASGTRYFQNQRLHGPLDVSAIDTFGRESVLRQVYVDDNPTVLREHSGEYIALEVTPNCNVSCRTCFNSSGAHQIDKEPLSYMDAGFAEAFATMLGANPFEGRSREICLSGGEPTLDLEKLASISHQFARLGGRNTVIIATNASVLPLGENALRDVFGTFPDTVQWQLSYNTPLQEQYRRWKRIRNPTYQIPDTKNPLLDKLRHVQRVAGSLGITTSIRIGELTHEDLFNTVVGVFGEAHVYRAAIRKIGEAIAVPEASGYGGPQSRNSESLYIKSDGQLFPRMDDVNSLSPFGRLYDIRTALN
jgi:hypothetical protein